MAGEFHFFEGTPEEFQAMVAETVAKQEMEYDDAIHGIIRAISEMKLEHLIVMKNLIHGLGDSPQGLGYWEGLMASEIARKKNVCVACGKNHQKMLEELSAAVEQDSELTRIITLMNTYHVEPVEDAVYNGAVRCLGVTEGAGPCGVTYPNLEDRMVRKPSECDGCAQKAAWG